MLKELFSPLGTASRLSFFLIVVISAAVEFCVTFALATSRQEFSPDVYYLMIAVAIAPFAWVQVCAAVRRLQDLKWHWVPALPLAPICLWSLWALLDTDLSSVA